MSVAETPKHRNPEATSEDLMPATSGVLAGGPARSPAFLFSHPAHMAGSRAGQGRVGEDCLPIQPHTSRHSRTRLIMDLCGDAIGVACIFFMLWVGLLFGGGQ